MWDISEWLLPKMGFVDLEENDEDKVEEQVQHEKKQIFFKMVCSFDDARAVVDEYKKDMECIILFNQVENPDSQEMMNYICGGIYALDGKIREAGANIFVISHVKP